MIMTLDGDRTIDKTPKAKAKQGLGGYILAGMAALGLAYLVTKDIELPSTVLIMGAVIGGVVLFFVGIGRPHVVTYVLVAYLPFSRELAGDFGGMAAAFNFTNLLMIFLMFVWLTGRHGKDEPLWLGTNLNFPIYLFLFLGFVSIARGAYYYSGGTYMARAVTEYKRWITPIFMYFLVVNTVKDRQTIKNVILLMATIVTIVGLMAMYDYFDLGEVSNLEKARIGGIADQPNQLAAFFNYYQFLILGFFLLNMNKFKYWSLLIPFGITFRGIMVTFSRGGYLGFALGLFGITFFRSKKLFATLLLFSFVAYLNPMILPGGVRYRMGQTVEKKGGYVDETAPLEDNLESSSRLRILIWKAGLAMIQDNPWFGVGYGLFSRRLRYYWEYKRRRDAHNTYIIIAAEMGIPTLIVFMWILWLAFRNAHVLYRTTSDPFARGAALGVIGGMFGLLMSNMFGSRLDAQEISSYFWILAALMVRLRILDTREGKIKSSRSGYPAGGKLDAA